MFSKSKEAEAQSLQNESLPPPPPYSNTTGSQHFTVDYNDWTTRMTIKDEQGTPLFVTERERASQRVTVMDTDGKIIGRSKTSSITTRLDVEMFTTSSLGRKFELRNHKTFGAPEYESPAFGGQHLEWKGKTMTKKIIYDLTDDAGKVYLKFESDPKTQIGKLKVSEECLSPERWQEVVVVLVSLLTRKLRNANDVPQYGVVN